MDGFAHKTTIHLCTVNDTRTSCHDAILDDDIGTDERAGIVGAENGAVVQLATALHLTSFTDAHIVHLLDIHHTRTSADVRNGILSVESGELSVKFTISQANWAVNPSKMTMLASPPSFSTEISVPLPKVLSSWLVIMPTFAT